MAEPPVSLDILTLTTQIVAAHVTHNTVAQETLPSLIRDVYRTLSSIGGDVARPVAEKLAPAVPIKKSIFNDYLVCLEDGKQLKMLKRHLATSYNMTPEQYREKWNLPPDYPMVAPSYAQHRSSLAKSIGLGTKSRNK